MYKYNFNILLLQLTKEQYKKVDKIIPEVLNITYSTWKQWRYIKVSDSREIRPQQLMKISSMFKCTVDDLIYKDEDQTIDLKEEFKNLQS